MIGLVDSSSLFKDRDILTQGHVSDIENKRKGVSDRVIEIICLKYGVNETWLRTGEGEMLEELTEIKSDIIILQNYKNEG